MVEFQGKFDENVTKSLNKQALKKLTWVYAVASAVFIVLGVIWLISPEDAFDIGLGVFFIIVGLLFTPLMLLLSKKSQKKMDESMHILSSETQVTYQFYPDRIFISQKKPIGENDYEYEATTNARYSYFYFVEETPDCYFMQISKSQSHVVNKRDLTQGTLEELNSILSYNLGSKFKPLR